MICNKCNQKLPDDSEFCQYCGNKIDKVVVAPVEEAVEEPKMVKTPDAVPAAPVAPVAPAVNDEPNIDGMISDEALNAILRIQAKNTIDAMEANSKTQPNNEGDADFGLVPEKPIFTLALQMVEGEKEYLSRLYTTNGEKIKYSRMGSISVDGINGMIDIYDTFLPSGGPYKTIYINMYGAKRSTKAPAGFTLGKPDARSMEDPVQPKEQPLAVTPQQNEKHGKTKYCSKCGSAIDSKTKKCTGCGKQYFRGLRFTKFSTTVIILAIVIVALSALCAFQHLNAQTVTSNLELEVSRLEQQAKNNEAIIKAKDSTIKKLESEIEDLEDEISNLQFGNLTDKWALEFYEEYAVLVNENSMKYHKYGCEDFDSSSFWIYNINAAEQKGYYACSKCH